MNPIPLYQPEVRVLLHKLIARAPSGGATGGATVSKRFAASAARSVIDLTPHIGEAGIVQTSKSISEPAGGWQITLADEAMQFDADFETVYGLAEPMDMIEIRMRHGAPTSAGAVPIVMRGFVTDVRRVETMGGGGQPQRAVVIAGQDYGKIWQIIQINYFAGYLVGQALISSFKLFELFGIGQQTVLTPAQFVRDVVRKIINPYLDRMMPAHSTLPRSIADDVRVTGGTVSPGIQTQEGTIFELLRAFGDVGPWNELFLEDREDGVHCVYRPAPYMDLSTGALIQRDAPDPVYVDVDAVDLVSINVSRSDANVANFYWVDSPRFNLITEVFRRQAAAESGDPTVVIKGHPNCDPNLYGNRVMRVSTQQGGTEMTTHNTGSLAAEHEAMEKSVAGWVDGRRRVIVESNRDNVVMERGSMRLRGNEALKAGAYLRLRRGSFVATYYILQVEHELVPFSGFFSTVQVDRGTGFVRRIAMSGSPYLSELA